MRIVLGSDHAGHKLKKHLLSFLKDNDYDVVDRGGFNEDPSDYPEYAQAVCQAVLNSEADFGILICGSGIGMSIAANRYPGIRAALCNSGPESALLARKHNNANILCLGGRLIDLPEAEQCVQVFLSTSFEGGRHQRRLGKIDRNKGDWE